MEKLAKCLVFQCINGWRLETNIYDLKTNIVTRKRVSQNSLKAEYTFYTM